MKCIGSTLGGVKSSFRIMGSFCFRHEIPHNLSNKGAIEMIQAMIEMEFAPDNVEEALKILRSIIERTMAEAGCISCSVYQDSEMVNQIFFAQEWSREEDLQRHLRSDEYTKVLLVMEMALTPPKVRFDTITSTRGIEIIEKARAQKE
jgi:quinol monooxygenase YgiN